jgi:hypothetical protein
MTENQADKLAYDKATAELRKENERLKAQVAGLVEAANKSLNTFWQRQSSIDDHSETYWSAQGTRNLPYSVLTTALNNTQATADAYTAKVREEAIEKAIVAIEDSACEYNSPNGHGPMVVLLSTAKAKLQALISETPSGEKGGA